MFDRFTERARKAIIIAREEALRFRHDALDCEHLLLAAIHDEKGVGNHALQELNVDIHDLRIDLENRLIHGTLPGQVANIPFSPSAKEVLRLAIELSREMRHNYVGTEHLLLAILREGDNLAALILAEYGVSEEKLHEEIQELLGETRQKNAKKKKSYKVYASLAQSSHNSPRNRKSTRRLGAKMKLPALSRY